MSFGITKCAQHVMLLAMKCVPEMHIVAHLRIPVYEIFLNNTATFKFSRHILSESPEVCGFSFFAINGNSIKIISRLHALRKLSHVICRYFFQ